MPKGSESSKLATESPSSDYTFRRLPAVVEAWQNIRGNPIVEPDWLLEAQRLDVVRPYPATDDGSLQISTLEGKHRANHGDWIVRGLAGEIYPVKPALFEKLYEVA